MLRPDTTVPIPENSAAFWIKILKLHDEPMPCSVNFDCRVF
jgi:hypothetical protein